MKPWTIQYAPAMPNEVQGQPSAIESLTRFILEYRSKKSKKLAIIHGPTGCGKTCSVYAIAKQMGLEIVELNASDVRNKDGLHSMLDGALFQQSLFSKGKIILLDEVDGLSGTKDRGAASTIADLAKKSPFPIICTATDAYHKKLKALRKVGELIEYQTLAHPSIAKVLSRIIQSEGITISDDDLKTIARRAGGDCRAAINDLQILTAITKTITKEDIESLSFRNKEESIHNALVRVFKTTDPNIAIDAFDNVGEDLDKVLLWVDENLPYEYEKPEDLARAYDFISRSDIMKRRIRRWQHWRFLVYIRAYLSAGIAVSKDEKYKKFIKYKPTSRILKLWMAKMKYAKRKAIAEKIAPMMHTSSKRIVKDTIPYLQVIFQNNHPDSQRIAQELKLDADEVAWLSKV